MRFEDTLRSGLARGQYPEAEGREEDWLAERITRHRQPLSSHEQCLPGDRWVRIEERRTSDGGNIGVRIDITDLKRRESSFRLLFESNPVPMFVFDTETLRYIAVNDAALMHYGYSRQQFLSMTALDMRPEEDRETFRADIKTFGNHRTAAPSRHKKSDGTIIEIEVYSRALTYDGRSARFASVIDITDRKRAEGELRRTREFLDTIIENVPAMISVKEAREQRYVLVNRAGEQLLASPATS